MSAGGELNPWPAFADMLFMLFVTTMVASVVITSWAVTSEEKLRGCGSSKVFMEDFADCLGANYVETDNACKVSLGDSRLKFATNQVMLAPAFQQYGQEVATCLADSVAVLATVDNPDVLQSIEFISIDGHTDCQGNDINNVRLGAGRASTIYEMFLEAVEERELEPSVRAAVLGKVAVRSFGKARPLPGSPCAADPDGGKFAEHPADRRVEIAVTSRLQLD